MTVHDAALDARCPACLAPVGEQCYSTSTDMPRLHPHRLRGLASAQRLVQCETCQGVGWRPEWRPSGLETKDV